VAHALDVESSSCTRYTVSKLFGGGSETEGIGAAEGVLIHKRELRDALIVQQSTNRRRLRKAGVSPRATGLMRLIARCVQSTAATCAWATATLLTHRSQRGSVSCGGVLNVNGRS